MTTPHLNGTRHDGQPAVVAVSWREERRLDRLAAARSAREDRRAELDARIAGADARDRRRREARQSRSARRSLARRRRAERRSALAAWFREHVTGLLFVPVIGVPGLLAWTAMAAYGVQVFGPPGVSLPAFSEGAMWAFAAAVTITRRRFPGRPVWHLLLGVAVFAGFGAVLNFAHGLASGSVIKGIVMALISVAGVIAHQLITAGPRRSRDVRSAERIQRVIARRERAIRKAALRHASAVLDPAGNARLTIRPGTVRLVRRRGRMSLEPVPHSPVWLPWPIVLPGTAEPASGLLLDMQAAEAVAAYRGWRSVLTAAPGSARMSDPGARSNVRPLVRPAPAPAPPAVAQNAVQAPPVPVRPREVKAVPPEPAQREPGTDRSGGSGGRPAPGSNGGSKRRAAKSQKSVLTPAEKRAKAEQLLAANQTLSAPELAALAGVSISTAKRIRARAQAAGAGKI